MRNLMSSNLFAGSVVVLMKRDVFKYNKLKSSNDHEHGYQFRSGVE